MDEIVRRLRKSSSRTSLSIKESLSRSRLNEAGEDEEEDITTEEEETPQEDIPAEDTQDSEDSSDDTSTEEFASDEEDYVDPDGDTEEENQEDGDEEDNEYVNPLDNPHAVKHTIGEEVLLAYSNGTKSKLKGEIDGYDKEGFYRILWSNGLTTDGITDLALASISKSTKESVCVCGNDKFVTEGKHVVCDSCGRKIRESKDPLSVADKMRPAGKRMIRSEAHPMNTSISETIKNAFKKQSIKESRLPEAFLKLVSSLQGQFWTRKDELHDDIEDQGCLVEEMNDEYVLISTEYEDEIYVIQVPIVGTSRTMTLDFDKAKSV